MDIIGVQLSQVLICAVSAAVMVLMVLRNRHLAQSFHLSSFPDSILRLFRVDGCIPVPAIAPRSVGRGRALLGRAPPEFGPCLVENRCVGVAGQCRR